MNLTSTRKSLMKNLMMFITIFLFVLLFISAIFIGFSQSSHFKAVPVLFNLFNDNAYLIVVSVGMTFVILTGEIDISVASTLAFTAVFSSWLLRAGLPAGLVILLVLSIGTAFGFLQGILVEKFQLQSFIVTLSGLFFLRGMCAIVSRESIPITNAFYHAAADARIAFGNPKTSGHINIYLYVFVALAVVFVAFIVMKYTRFGRTLYAVGGNRQSAELMGLPVSQTRIAVFAISGFCASLAGVLFSLYTLAGYALQNMGLEMDAISSAVIGGTLLTGGVGGVLGTTFGVLIEGTIQTIVTLLNLNAWWTKVTVGLMLCLFVVLQRIVMLRNEAKQ